MKKSRFTETQMASMLKQADAGVPVKHIRKRCQGKLSAERMNFRLGVRSKPWK